MTLIRFKTIHNAGVSRNKYRAALAEKRLRPHTKGVYAGSKYPVFIDSEAEAAFGLPRGSLVSR